MMQGECISNNVFPVVSQKNGRCKGEISHTKNMAKLILGWTEFFTVQSEKLSQESFRQIAEN